MVADGGRWRSTTWTIKIEGCLIGAGACQLVGLAVLLSLSC